MMPKVLVVTGGIGAGKSELSRMLAAKGIPVYISDDMTKFLYDRDEVLRASLRELLGDSVFCGDKLDRRAMAEIIFSDDAKLKAVEQLVHPAVYRDFAAWKAERAEYPLVAFESAIVLERGMPEGFADYVLYVDAPKRERFFRALHRDRGSGPEIICRMQCQGAGPDHPDVDFVIDNSGSFEDLERALDAVLAKIEPGKV